MAASIGTRRLCSVELESDTCVDVVMYNVDCQTMANWRKITR